MDVGVICIDPTTTHIGIGDQQFPFVNGVARVPMGLAAGLLHLSHRFRVVPLSPEEQSTALVPVAPSLPALASADGETGADPASETGDEAQAADTPAEAADDAKAAQDKGARGSKK